MAAHKVGGGVADAQGVDFGLGNALAQFVFTGDVVSVDFVLAGVDIDVDELADIGLGQGGADFLPVNLFAQVGDLFRG